MDDPAKSVVQCLAWRERLVAAFMCQDPKSGTKKTLDEGVSSPEKSSEWKRGHIVRCAVRVEDVEDCC